MSTPSSSLNSLPAIACIGGGNMGTAILSGLAALAQAPALTVIDPSPLVAERFATGPIAYSAEASAVSRAEVVILAVKPQMGEQVAAQLRQYLRPEQLIISILAGTTLASLAKWFPDNPRLIRAMPNTPMAIAKGMVGLAPKPGLDAAAIAMAQQIFAVSAKVMVIEEHSMDALTAISGSGPAYVFRFAEAMQEAAQALGFSPLQAKTLVATTLQGAVDYLVAQSASASAASGDPAAFPAGLLREQVTSPGGTTAAALEVFQQEDFAGMVSRAVKAAQQRSLELARLQD